MCTLTYIPFSNGDFLVTSNRDEGTMRKGASLPQIVEYPLGNKVLSPIDGEAGGSWIGLSDDNRLAVLLNGAFAAHDHHPPYRKSRGLVLMDAFGYSSFEKFYDDYGCQGIEPFTMVMFAFAEGKQIMTMKWDGQQKYLEDGDPEHPHIWMAPKLYPQDSIKKAKEEFKEFLEEYSPHSASSALSFHAFQDYHEKMIRHGHRPVDVVDTLSISQLRVFGESIVFHHIDKRTNVTGTYQLK